MQRGLSKGLGLDSITRGLGEKMAIHIAEGKRRPEPPMQAAKFASEGGIALRNHLPIYTHRKEYKKNTTCFEEYKCRLEGKFSIDIKNVAVSNACMDMLKGAQRQMRYRLKKKYFQGMPSNEVRTTSPLTTMTDDEWRKLVELWTSAEHKDTCSKNKICRGKVKLQQATGSRCYTAHAYIAKQQKYKDKEPTAIDLFKETHCSKKRGFSEHVKEAIAAMEAIVAETEEEGQQPKSSAEVVSKVLPKSSKFLQNVGLQAANKSRSGGACDLQVKQLQAQLEAEKQESAGLRLELDNLKTNAIESEAKIDSLQKKQEETNALLRQLISFNHGQVNPASNL